MRIYYYAAFWIKIHISIDEGVGIYIFDAADMVSEVESAVNIAKKG